MSTVYCFIVSWNPLIFIHFKCISEARLNKLPKIPLRLWWESFCMHWERHLLWILGYLDICIFSLQDLQNIWKITKLFFAEIRCFYMRNTVCVVCVVSFINLFRFHSLLAHFIICIFLLYRLNIFYLHVCELITFFLWTVLKKTEQLIIKWINCLSPLSKGFLCRSIADFLNLNDLYTVILSILIMEKHLFWFCYTWLNFIAMWINCTAK